MAEIISNAKADEAVEKLVLQIIAEHRECHGEYALLAPAAIARRAELPLDTIQKAIESLWCKGKYDEPLVYGA
jgi:hypothetical protein